MMKLHSIVSSLMLASVAADYSSLRELGGGGKRGRSGKRGGSHCRSVTITERLDLFLDETLNIIIGDDGETPGDIITGNIPIYDKKNENIRGSLQYTDYILPGDQVLGNAMYTFTDKDGYEQGQISVKYTNSDPFLKTIDGGTGIYACASGVARVPKETEELAQVEFVICDDCRIPKKYYH